MFLLAIPNYYWVFAIDCFGLSLNWDFDEGLTGGGGLVEALSTSKEVRMWLLLFSAIGLKVPTPIIDKWLMRGEIFSYDYVDPPPFLYFSNLVG